VSVKGRIVGIEAIPIVISGTRSFRISEGQADVHTSVLLRILTDQDGLEGHGEVVSAPPGKPEEFVEEIVGAVRRYIGPAIQGLGVMDRRVAVQRVAKALKGRIWTKAALDVALHDLQAKAMGVSVAALFGGRLTEEIPVIGPVVGIAAPEVMASEAAELARTGYGAIKIKIGEAIAGDIDRVGAVREAIGPVPRLRVDANDHYRPADAIRLIRAIERYDIDHVEQPVARGDFMGFAEVRRCVGIPITSDDTVATPMDAMTLARLNAVDRVKVKVSKHGFTGAQQIIAILEAAGIGCVLGHVFEMGLAATAEAQLAACMPNLITPHEIGSLQPIGATADLIKARARPRPNTIRLPDEPGLGVALDWSTIERYRIDVAGGKA
jgi:L-Ala-D/L-Glu epimerase